MKIRVPPRERREREFAVRERVCGFVNWIRVFLGEGEKLPPKRLGSGKIWPKLF